MHARMALDMEVNVAMQEIAKMALASVTRASKDLNVKFRVSFFFRENAIQPRYLFYSNAGFSCDKSADSCRWNGCHHFIRSN